MHSSTGSLRQRQRTSTACTECRRRKQKCNQAKDRPCNNCARRYPPVACTYDVGRSPAIDRIVALNDESIEDDERRSIASSSRTNEDMNPDYRVSSSQNLLTDVPVVPSNHYPLSTSHPFYAPLDTRAYYRPRTDESSSSHAVEPYSSSTNEFQYDHGYGGNQASGSAAGQTYDSGFYSNSDLQYGWLSTNGDPGAFLGTGTVFDVLNDLPIDSSRRNAELFHFFHQSLAPFLVTIDAKDPPAEFYREWTPWVVQSPVLSSLTILSASCYQSEVKGLDVATCPETIAIQSKIISVINSQLKNNFAGVPLDVIASVMYLATIEWYWGEVGSFWAHMRGLKEMLRLRGGIETLPQDSMLRNQLILTDYKIACSCERDLSLQNDSNRVNIAEVVTSYPTKFENPLLESGTRFLDIFQTLDLSQAVAEILDDMRFLTKSITSLHIKLATEQECAKFQATALWTHNRIKGLPVMYPTGSGSSSDLIYESCRIAALIYSSAILSRKPISQSCTPAQRQDLFSKMWRVPMSRWKKLPGILLWIVLVVCPSGGENLQGKFPKMMITATTMYIGVLDHETAVACLRGFLKVQRWIAKAEEETAAQSGESSVLVDRSRGEPSSNSQSEIPGD